MTKIVLINHSFQSDYYSRRWRLFAQKYKDVDITLLTPEVFDWYYQKSYTYKGAVRMEGHEEDCENFHIRTFKKKYRYSLISDDFKRLLLEIKPDVVYHIGMHTQLSLVQIGRIVKKYLPKTKIILFSMRGPAMDNVWPRRFNTLKQYLKDVYLYFYKKPVLRYVNSHYDAIFCHYPEAVDCFRREGYKGRIYMQTQVGVNPEWFHPDEVSRKEIREKYNLGDSFVFGSATRFTDDKGLEEIIEALPQSGNWKFLMMGTGSDAYILKIKEKIKSRGLEDKIILPGFINSFEIAKYWNAIDCAVHVPQTTPFWVETFSLSVVQPMITSKPIIGNTSGSVPYQIGPEGMIVPEGNIKLLSEKMKWVLDNPQKAKLIGERMRDRAIKCFSVPQLNELFYKTIKEDILTGGYDEKKSDMTKWSEL
ncbi:glycosyltransferase family 4 protein [Xylanibacter ruminicola]|uniref:Glycosyltransferase involved in cell wall bisynthesis n=1 Tax=Xylanibacter ruminicola TaxID=839 RepID=A0A1M6R762_XYLRU|nr:glycosyltransferase [Xylanibacter ruminicola]SHK28315.1 Glycosyltransferase involved in cell wall bisynthesis [Xylanibacter ruminicola]